MHSGTSACRAIGIHDPLHHLSTALGFARKHGPLLLVRARPAHGTFRVAGNIARSPRPGGPRQPANDRRPSTRFAIPIPPSSSSPPKNARCHQLPALHTRPVTDVQGVPHCTIYVGLPVNREGSVKNGNHSCRFHHSLMTWETCPREYKEGPSRGWLSQQLAVFSASTTTKLS